MDSSVNGLDPQSELEGLDLPEMGALGYPEFQLVTPGLGRSVEIGAAD